jgi:hypothetical protein
LIDKKYIASLARSAYEAHDPKNQDHKYNRCQICHYTRHPCNTFELAEAILILLGELEDEN